MKSIKRGRGPSAMGGIGSIFAAVFGVFWTVMAASMGAPLIFCLFGVLFILMAAVQAAYNWKNALSEDRFSEYDIVDSEEAGESMAAGERDGERLVSRGERAGVPQISGDLKNQGMALRYCPYCGASVKKDFRFCGSCGRELPEEQEPKV